MISKGLQGQGGLGLVHGLQALLATVLQTALPQAGPAGTKGSEATLFALQQAVADDGARLPTNIHRIISAAPALATSLVSMDSTPQ